MPTERATATKDLGVEWMPEIPAHWTVKRLKHISPRVDFGLVINPSAYVKNDGVPFLFGGDIQPGKILFEKARRMSDEDSRNLHQSRLHPGDLVTVRVGYPGVTVVEPPELEGTNCASVMVVRGAKTFVSQWLCYAMNSTLGSDQINVVKYGAAKEQFNISHAVEFVFPVPPREEQQSIAAFLDRKTAQIDAVVAKKQRLIERLQEKRQALISHTVTKGLDPHAPMKDSGIEWLGEIPAHWKAKALRRFRCVVQTGPFGSQLHAHEYVSGQTPVINPVNLINGRVVPSEDVTVDDEVLKRLPHQILKDGDVVFSRRGELGRCALVTSREAGWLCGTGSMILRLHHSEYSPSYLSRYLSLPLFKEYFESFSVGAIMDSLSSETLLALPMLVPPVDEQKKIAAYCDRASHHHEHLLDRLERQITKLQEYRQTLISAAVTGKIDVKKDAAC